jgi:hypothetical protein
MNYGQRSPGRLRVAVVLAGTTLMAAFVLHCIAASMYYEINTTILRMAASGAVAAGARYLPRNPRTAVLVTRSYANLIGVLPNEIRSVEVSPDLHTLTIRLGRKVPVYLTILNVGLPGRDIGVTAWARKHADNPQDLSA